jgi:TonB family protein
VTSMPVIDVFIRTSVLLAIGLLAVRWLRPQSAALRHWVLAMAIALAAAQPLLRSAMPEWQMPATIVLAGLASSEAGRTGDAAVTIEEQFEAIAAPAARNWGATLMNAWLAGTLLGLAAMFGAIAWLWWHSRRARECGGVWLEERDAVAGSMALGVSVPILETSHPALLVTWGAWRPAILVPRGAAAWPRERVRLVLAHELAHVQRRDWLVQLAAELARACYWPNPLFWLACRRLRIESEQACDDRVLAHGITGTSYASHLVDLARSFRAHGRTWLPAPSMARPSTLERRVVAMLNANINRLPLSRWRRFATAIVLIAAALPVAAASQRAAAPNGVLRDPQGRVLPAATVRLSAIGQEAIHETQSDSAGTFQFPEIPYGDYMLSARLPGFLSARQRVRVSAGMPSLNITLQVGTLRETVTVRSDGSAQAPAVSTKAALPMPTPPPCGSTELGGNLKPPMKLKDVRPVYKPELAANNVEGEVLLQAVIGVDGKVRGIEVVSAVNADLEEAAIRAVSQWEFSPTYLNCQAIEVRMFVSVRFALDR